MTYKQLFTYGKIYKYIFFYSLNVGDIKWSQQQKQRNKFSIFLIAKKLD